MGSRDAKIYLYDGTSYALRAKCEKHSSFITHLDFSSDSSYLQSNCGAYELLYYNAMDGTFISSASQLKDAQWATWTCVLGWPVTGSFFHSVACDRACHLPSRRRCRTLLTRSIALAPISLDQAFGRIWKSATTPTWRRATDQTTASS